MTETRSLAEQGWVISNAVPTQYNNANGVSQDSMLPFARDSRERLWTILGHSRVGGLTLWRGTTVEDMEKVGPLKYNFEFGEAGYAFNGIPYPDGVASRGGVWACGLWIDPSDDTFYCYVHNETGWGAGATSYTAHGFQEGEPDFRHIGLMISHDYGRTWDFDGWIITSHEPCWTTEFQPEGVTGGQNPGAFILCAGDLTLFVNREDGFLYIYYSQGGPGFESMVYAARAPIASNGRPGSWVKFYNESFSEPGNMGRETPVCGRQACEPCVVYSTYLKQFMLASYNDKLWHEGQGACQIAFSPDNVHFGDPIPLDPTRKDLSRPYWTMCNTLTKGTPAVVGQTFRLLYQNASFDVDKVDVTIA
ncbi:MAG: hypothetical protein ACYC6L_10675 [Anaerolineae bacterium]